MENLISSEKQKSGMMEKTALKSLNDDAAKSEPPKDRWSLVYLIFYLLGLGTLLPWNFFITAQTYWMYKFRELNETYQEQDPNHRSDLQTSFTSYLSVASMVPNTIFLMLNTILSRRIQLRIRLVFSLIFVIILFIITVVLVQVDTDSWQTAFFGFTLLTVVILNCNTAVFQGALFGLAGKFPSKITQAIMNGQALGGIFASVASILSIIGGSSPVDSAFGYFLAAVITLILSILAYLNLYRFEYYKFYLEEKSEMELTQVTSNRSKNVPFWHIFKKIKVYAISVCLVFTVTLAIFPAVTVLVVSTDTASGAEWNVKYFIPVGCFLIYNVGDYVGRMAAGWHGLPKTRIPLLPIFCVARIAFIPLLMFCNAHPRVFSSVAFNHDVYFLLFMSLLSLSGGYLASEAMIHGPQYVEAEHQEAAGGMMAFFLGLGLMLGAALSNGFVRLL